MNRAFRNDCNLIEVRLLKRNQLEVHRASGQSRNDPNLV